MRAPLIALLLVNASLAHAEAIEPGAAALALFQEGRALAATGDYPAACAKFEAARGFAPWVGVLLNLADCYEHVGRTASAWVIFQQAHDLAARTDDPRTAYASSRARALEPVISYVTLDATAATGARISLDGRALLPGSMDAGLPVDPGAHTISASAEGRASWTTTIEVAPAARAHVRVPALVALPSLARPTRPPSSQPPQRRTRTGLSLAIGGVGIAALGASIVFGRKAIAFRDSALATECDADLHCTEEGVRLVNRGRRHGDIATASAIGGLAVLTAAVVIYWTSPVERASVAPVVGPGLVGLAYGGAL